MTVDRESIRQRKQEWRQWALKMRAGVTPDERQEIGVATARAAAKLLPREGRGVLLYRSIRGEVCTDALWRMAQAKGCFIGLPRVAPGLPNVPNMEAYRVKASPTAIMLKKGDYGVEEPEPDPSLLMTPEQFVVAFVPGLLFDRNGLRLGRGGGHFDCFLSRCNPTCIKVGLGYSWQLTEDPLPHEEHDVSMDMLLIGGELIDLRQGMKADPS